MSDAGVRSWRRCAGPAIICFAAFIGTAPQLLRGNSCGHDFDFHLVSWVDALENWREGVFFPHWSPTSNFGAGEPRFIFYSPVSWMLGAAFGSIFPWKGVPLAITCLFLACAGLATRALARQTLPEGPSTLAGCAALFSGYALFTAYERSDFGELSGGFWVPLLLLLIFRDRNRTSTTWRRAFDGSAALLAVVLAGAWLSNPPLGVMASYLLAAMALLTAVLWKSWAPILRASVAVVLGLGLTAFYLLPAAIEQKWIDLNQILGDPGYTVENNWLFARHSNPALELHDVELFKASVIAASMLTVAFTGIVICWFRGGLHDRRRWWLPLAIIPVFILFLQFPISDFAWNLLPKMRFLQFPWRWLVVLQAPMAIFFASAVWVNRPRWRVLVLAATGGLFLFATLLAGFNFFQSCDDEDAVWAMMDAYYEGTGFQGTDEYAPPYADNTTLAMGLPQSCLVASPTTVLGQGSAGANLEWLPDQDSCEATFNRAPNPGKPAVEHLRIAANAAHAAYLILRLRNYPAWQVRVNGQLLQSLPERTDGLIAVPVPRGQFEVTADWTTTGDVLLSRWIATLALLLVTALWLLERRPTPTRLS
jgi:hypothetical protein